MNVKDGRGSAALTRRVRADTPCRSTRRALILAAAACPAFTWTGAALAQAMQTPVVIGLLAARSREPSGKLHAAFREGLAALGLKEGSQVVIAGPSGESAIMALSAS